MTNLPSETECVTAKIGCMAGEEINQNNFDIDDFDTDMDSVENIDDANMDVSPIYMDESPDNIDESPDNIDDSVWKLPTDEAFRNINSYHEAEDYDGGKCLS
ncbi:hypothetical protein INT47_004469 [Mucor saturninus]|uniref:Uncharacterized protein n=1 Tax=Mucor saturninus TaxID=64648 RepID=A0A8H7QTK3_9FUNG|nr:hypothetical protein INT47_004469 [Mucor saturninus]